MNGSTTWHNSRLTQIDLTTPASHSPRGSQHKLRSCRSIEPKNFSILAMFSAVCLKLDGHWKRIVLAFRAFAEESVAAQASFTIAVALKYPASAFSVSEI